MDRWSVRLAVVMALTMVVGVAVVLAATAGVTWAHPPELGSPAPVRAFAGARGEACPPGHPARSVADVIDPRQWYLTLPTGKEGDPDTVDGAALTTLSNPAFRFDPRRGGVAFRATAGGVTTKNSAYPRSELREETGGEHAAWSNTAGTHTLDVCQAVTELPAAKPHVVTAQIHDAENDVMEVRLEGRKLMAQYADGKKDVVLDPAYRLGTPYAVRIQAADGRITVSYNGKPMGTIDQAGSGWYFKTGAYLQSNPDKGDAAAAAGTVLLYSAVVRHDGAAGAPTGATARPTCGSSTREPSDLGVDQATPTTTVASSA